MIINSLASRKSNWDFRYEIFKHISWIDIFSIYLRNCPQVNAKGLLSWKLSIGSAGSGNGLVPSGNKPLLEPMLSQFYVTKWSH